MSYSTTFHGEITFDPPIPYGEIKSSPHYLPNWHKASRPGDLVFITEERDEETDIGLVKIIEAVGVHGVDEARGYTALAELEGIVSAYLHVTGGAVRDFRGRLDAEGEGHGDGPDIWRLKVVNHHAVKFEPRIIWPEESE